ncbi:MAG: hypothetical protein LBI19_03230 [Oscillospiraceae bacterium]|jgi:hypothetical protein|nr:hypothetical protein [Oscillospiraceae bacterium]
MMDKRSPLAATLCRGCKKRRKCDGAHMEQIIEQYKGFVLVSLNCYPRTLTPEYLNELNAGVVDLIKANPSNS